MNIKSKPRRLSLSNVLGDDQTQGTSVSYDFLNSRAKQEGSNLFSIVRLIIHMAI